MKGATYSVTSSVASDTARGLGAGVGADGCRCWCWNTWVSPLPPLVPVPRS